MKPGITIQIPTWKNNKQLDDCIQSLIRFIEYPMEVVVINNDSADSGKKAIDELVESYPVENVRVLHAESNLGWMAAQNLALKECETEYVMLLNDDVVFMPYDLTFMKRLTSHFENDKVGAVGPVSNFVMGSQNLWNISLPVHHTTTLLIGFCVAMRTDLIRDIGGLDETLPGGDDLDWSIRIRDTGYDLVVDRTCYLHHIGQQTGRRVKSDWDSLNSQDLTNNALIRRHGVRKWYVAFQSGVGEMTGHEQN